MIRLQTGYNIVADLPHGFVFLLGGLLISLHFDWPRPVWYNRDWALNERGYIQGMPVHRAKPKRWLLRGMKFPFKFRMRWL